MTPRVIASQPPEFLKHLFSSHTLKRLGSWQEMLVLNARSHSAGGSGRPGRVLVRHERALIKGPRQVAEI